MAMIYYGNIRASLTLPFLVLVLLSIIAITTKETRAYLQPDSLPLSDYYSKQLLVDYDDNNNINNNIQALEDGTSYSEPAYLVSTRGGQSGLLEVPLRQSLVGSSASNIDGSRPTSRLETVDIDMKRLVEYLRQLESSKGDHTTEEEDVESGNDISNDINSHLPANNPLGDTISGPINDPAEFEATLGYLTNQLNHEIPNTSNRSALLDSLMSVYLGNLMRELENKNGDNRISGDHDSELSATVTDSTGPRLASTTSASRYGGGEYIDHPLALIGHQYVQGGAGEGRQLLGPEGTFENVQVIKSDHAVPSYCDPPNPCPIGYTAEDGCLENFINSASFSREYQAKQQCSCDNEHSLFNCASPVSNLNSNQEVSASNDDTVSSSTAVDQGGDGGSELMRGSHDSEQEALMNSIADEATNRQQQQVSSLDTLARTIQNRFGNLDSVRNLIAAEHDDGHQYATIAK